MIDLNSTLFYKCNFVLRGDTDVLWEVIHAIRTWLLSKHNRYGQVVKEDLREWTKIKFDISNRNLSNDLGKVYIESCNHFGYKTSVHYWACKVVETFFAGERGIAPRKWITDIGLNLLSENHAELSYVVSYSDAAGYIGLCEPDPEISLPKVIRLLINHKKIETTYGNDVILDKPIKKHAGDLPDFWIHVLAKDRELPIVLVSPEKTLDNEFIFPVPPHELAEALVGNATVYYSDSHVFFEEMDYFVSLRYRCKKGEIRIFYSPCNPNEPDDYSRHRYISTQDIQRWGKDGVIRVLRRALCQDIHFYDSQKLIRLETCKDMNEENAYLERLEKTSKTADLKVEYIKKRAESSNEELMQEALKVVDQLQQVESEKRALDRQVTDLKNEKYSLESRINSYLPIVTSAGVIENALIRLKEIDEYPETATDLAKLFICIYPESIDFTERGWRSLEECEKNLSIIWQTLWHSATSLRDLYMLESGDMEKLFDDSVSGFSLARGQGRGTRRDADLMRNFVDTYSGREISIETHLRKGINDNDPRSIRSYFCYLPDEKKIVIGHIGNHLESNLSRKIK